MANRVQHLFTIPGSADFLDVLIRALLDGRLVAGFPAERDDPLCLAGARIYLPTRRACRLARGRFLDVLGSDAAVLPRIIAIGDVDEDELDFAESASGEAALDLPKALDVLERRLLLAQLVAKWATSPQARAQGGAPLVAHSPAAAVALADDLARLIDDMTTRGVDWSRLDSLVPANVDDYWQLTLRFLKEIRCAWCGILQAHGAIEQAARRDLLIEAEAERLGKAEGPVIAAGSTGSMPSTARLLEVIAGLPHGAVVLPGLDTDLDEAAWRMIGSGGGAPDDFGPASGHPQFAMHALLQRLQVGRDAVTSLCEPSRHGREQLLSEALRPAAATAAWPEKLREPIFGAHIDSALASLAVIEAGNAEDEALAIAVALREAVEEPDKTAALVTPDRALARRVVAALERWNVPVDDSGGDALGDTPAGIFARLAIEVGLGGAAPVPLLALLKHPLLRLGKPHGTRARAIAALERAILRGPRPAPGFDGLDKALAGFRRERADLHPRDPRKGLTNADLDAAERLIADLRSAMAPLTDISGGPQPLAKLIRAHIAAISMLSGSGRDDDAIAAFAGYDGLALREAFERGMASDAGAALKIAPSDYADLFRTAIADVVVRRPEVSGVRVRILGPLEARLQSYDRIVLGGLVEGTWPPQPRSDPWLSRPMRHNLGLDLPERRVGLSAHDFAQALGAREVILTRATRVAGAPTVASRFMQRLAAVAGKPLWEQAVARGARYLAFARDLNRSLQRIRMKRPEPAPPLAARPSQMSVTDVENWLRDPYTIYAKHVLHLAPLDAVDTPPGAADRGTVIHAAIAEFTRRFADGLPADPVGELLMIGEEHFRVLADFPEARAFWWPRFKRIASWFADWEQQRRGNISTLFAEKSGKIEISAGTRIFRLTARADRVELANGRLAVLDYKTGTVPTSSQVESGLSPQLTLEAAILREGGFADIAAKLPVAELIYISLKGGDPAGMPKPVEFKNSSPDAEADRALAKLSDLVRCFENESEPYRSMVQPMWRTRYGDYDHLARVKEWSESGGAIDELIP